MNPAERNVCFRAFDRAKLWQAYILVYKVNGALCAQCTDFIDFATFKWGDMTPIMKISPYGHINFYDERYRP